MNKHTPSLLPEQEKLRASLALMRALAHPLRLDIIDLIDHHQELNVGDIYKALKIEQALASQQSRILRQADLVQTRREQKFIFYRLNYEIVDQASKLAIPLASMVS